MKQQNANEKREYFRINDMVTLLVKPLSNEDIKIKDELYETRWRDTGFISELAYNKEEQLPTFTQIEKKYPEVATYIAYLENELKKVTFRLGVNDDHLPKKPTHQVNLSAGGLRFMSDEAFAKDSLIELTIRLFPSRSLIFIYAKILRSEAAETDGKKCWAIASEFTHIHEEDQEALIKHIHKWQMNRLQVKHNHQA